jgi:hypothetical protein
MTTPGRRYGADDRERGDYQRAREIGQRRLTANMAAGTRISISRRLVVVERFPEKSENQDRKHDENPDRDRSGRRF